MVYKLNTLFEHPMKLIVLKEQIKNKKFFSYPKLPRELVKLLNEISYSKYVGSIVIETSKDIVSVRETLTNEINGDVRTYRLSNSLVSIIVCESNIKIKTNEQQLIAFSMLRNYKIYEEDCVKEFIRSYLNSLNNTFSNHYIIEQMKREKEIEITYYNNYLLCEVFINSLNIKLPMHEFIDTIYYVMAEC